MDKNCNKGVMMSTSPILPMISSNDKRKKLHIVKILQEFKTKDTLEIMTTVIIANDNPRSWQLCLKNILTLKKASLNALQRSLDIKQ